MPDLLERLKATLAVRYVVEREIGRGGMAVVFKAEDLRHHRKVAVKVLHPELTVALGAERFLHEIEIVAGLQHPHILPLYESGEADGLLYYVMPFAEGESLWDRLDREKQLPVDESVRIAIEVADGLAYAHRKGVVHRDVKPGNILLAEGHAVIADFGIARAIEAAKADRVTSTGLGVGTPLYASPEQATAQETLDGRTDIYSLGCVLYEMLAGEPPLTGATPQMIQARRLSQTPTALHTLRDTVPPALDSVIARALARIPADRYATASQFGQALQAALFAATPAALADLATTPGALSMTPTAVSPAPRKRRTAWLVAAVALVGVGAGAWFVGQQVTTPETAPGQGATATDSLREDVRVVRLTEASFDAATAISNSGKRLAVCERASTASGARLAVADLNTPESSRTVAVLDACDLVEWAAGDGTIHFVGSHMGRRGHYSVSSDGGAVRPADCAPSRLSVDGTWCLSGGGRQHVRLLRVGGTAADHRLVYISDEYADLRIVGWFPHGQEFLVVGQDLQGTASFLMVNPERSNVRLLAHEAGKVNNRSESVAGDGSAVYYFREALGGSDLMRVDVLEARTSIVQPERLLTIGGYVDLATLASSNDRLRMVVRRGENSSRIVRLRAGVSGNGASLETLVDWGSLGKVDVSKDGDWVSYTKRGNTESGLYKRHIDSGAETKLVASASIGAHTWSPDGRFIAFTAAWQDTTRLWLAPSQGGWTVSLSDFEASPHTVPLVWEGDRLLARDVYSCLVTLERIEFEGQSMSEWNDPRGAPPRWAKGDQQVIWDSLMDVCYSGRLNVAAPDGERTVVMSVGLPRILSLPSMETSELELSRESIASFLVDDWRPIGWTDDGHGLYIRRNDQVYVRPLDSDDQTLQLLLSLPDSEHGDWRRCLPRRGSGREFICVERYVESHASLIENFDPHVN